jgi:aryl-alcohol dehydrogenase-like predicted oxidoreductase
MDNSFFNTVLGNTGLKVCRLGLSGTYRPGKKVIYKAIDEGINMFFYFGIDTQMISVMRDVIRRDREKYVVMTGANNFLLGHFNLRKALEKKLRRLKTDYIDIFGYLGVIKESDLTSHIIEEFNRFKEEGKIRFSAISTHDRKLAGKLAANGMLDTLMIRYNGAHRGAETDIFPHLQPHNPGIISYTATRWRFMMRRPRGWSKDERIPTAGDAYRFVLSNPDVHVCLSAPSNIKQFNHNLEAFRKGPLSDDELAFMRRFGDKVHAQARKGFFNRLMPFSRADIHQADTISR